jgi:hypothetical protein
MWHMRWGCLALLLISLTGAFFLTYNVSWSRGTVEAKPWSFGVADTQLLVDSGQSPIANVRVLTQDTDLLAGDLAEFLGTPEVLEPVSQAVGTQEGSISTEAQIIGDVPLQQTDAQEAQRGIQILDAARRYSILARVDQQTFVVQLFTQAPTEAKAVRMANVAAQALSKYVASVVTEDRIAKRRSVILRQIQAATGGTVARTLSRSAAVLFAILFFALGTIALFTLRRWHSDWAARAPG